MAKKNGKQDAPIIPPRPTINASIMALEKALKDATEDGNKRLQESLKKSINALRAKLNSSKSG